MHLYHRPDNVSNVANLATSVYSKALHTPNALALASSKSSLSYRELASSASQLARCLRTHSPKHAAQACVGILGSRSVEACIALLGACWSGAAYVPLGTKIPEDRLLSIMTQCGLTALIADADGRKLLTPGVLACGVPLVITPNAGALTGVPEGVAVVDFEDLLSQPPADVLEPAEMGPHDLAYILFTSGTTGVPKGVMIGAQAADHYARMMSRYLGIRSDDRVLETFELTFDVSVHNMFTTWFAGAALYLLPGAITMNAAKFVRANALTVWALVASFGDMLRQLNAIPPNSLPSLRVTMFGGEPLNPHLVSDWSKAAPNSAIYNLYGPTEATVTCLAQRLDPLAIESEGRDFVAIGTPLEGNEAVILNERQEEAECGRPGELAIAGAQLAIGYLGMPELTASRFRTIRGKRWYLTGDSAVRDANGVFHCHGRIDHQVKIRGFRVELDGIEAHVRRAFGAKQAIAVAWPIVNGTAQGIVAFVSGASTSIEHGNLELKKSLPDYMLPSTIINLGGELPLTENGKVDRRALLRQLEKGAAT